MYVARAECDSSLAAHRFCLVYGTQSSGQLNSEGRLAQTEVAARGFHGAGAFARVGVVCRGERAEGVGGNEGVVTQGVG